MDLQNTSLAIIAQKVPGATALFNQFNLSFCCGGKQTLAEAAAEKGLELIGLLSALEKLAQKEIQIAPESMDDGELIDYLLKRFHDTHRHELPELIRLAQRVETVHGDRENCPNGLAAHLNQMFHELESHMQKEEQILFPMINAGRGKMALMPMSVMMDEHVDHEEAIEQLKKLTGDLIIPIGACNTWRALYLGLQKLVGDLERHIEIENTVLFARYLPEQTSTSLDKSEGTCCGSCH